MFAYFGIVTAKKIVAIGRNKFFCNHLALGGDGGALQCFFRSVFRGAYKPYEVNLLKAIPCYNREVKVSKNRNMCNNFTNS